MNRQTSVLGGLTAAVLFSGALWGAILQSQTNKQFSVAITDPARNGVEVGREMVVKGTASIPSGNYLWVLLHRTEGYKTVWYPQEQGEIDAKTKRWSARAVFDGPKDIGYEFEIAVITVDGKEHARLQAYRVNAMQTQNWFAIEMPPTTSAPLIRRVKKVSDN